MDVKKIIEELVDTFLKAGELSISLRDEGLKKEIKSDNTPVSNGDLEVNKIITDKIIKLTPQFPIISEETSDNRSIKDLKDFWLIDPIDGTRSYVIGNPTWSNLISLNYKGNPILGLANFPRLNKYYYNVSNKLAYVVEKGKKENY